MASLSTGNVFVNEPSYMAVGHAGSGRPFTDIGLMPMANVSFSISKNGSNINSVFIDIKLIRIVPKSIDALLPFMGGSDNAYGVNADRCFRTLPAIHIRPHSSMGIKGTMYQWWFPSCKCIHMSSMNYGLDDTQPPNTDQGITMRFKAMELPVDHGTPFNVIDKCGRLAFMGDPKEFVDADWEADLPVGYTIKS